MRKKPSTSKAVEHLATHCRAALWLLPLALGACQKLDINPMRPAPQTGPFVREAGRSMPIPVPSMPKPPMAPTGPLPMSPDMPRPPDDARPPTPMPPTPPMPPMPPPPPPPLVKAVQGRLLLLSGSGVQPTFLGMKRFLRYAGVPFDEWIVAQRGRAPASADLVVETTGRMEGRYQGLVMSTSPLLLDETESAKPALTEADLRVLATYQVEFGVRQLNLYIYPTVDYGFSDPTFSGEAATAATVTSEGAAIFSRVAHRFSIDGAWLYLARPVAQTQTTPLVTDGQGRALAVLHRYRDGREALSMTFDGAPYLLHTLALGPDLLHWVSGGIYLGEFRVYAGAQVDDYYMENNLWPEPEGSDLVYRMTGADATATANWQIGERRAPTTAGFAIDMAYCGIGTTGEYLMGDTLLPATKNVQAHFKWINHTFTHLNLDAVPYMTARKDLADNIDLGKAIGFAQFNVVNLVTPDISGLNSPMALQAAWDVGVRYVVSDTSRFMVDPPENDGVYNRHQPGILEIPRRPTNLFYNVSTPSEWTGEYNQFYGRLGTVRPPAGWGVDLTYDQVLDKESDVLVRYMLTGEIYPWMFHQANLRAYDGRHTLLTDLLARTFAKYRSYLQMPVSSPTMDVLGEHIAARMRRRKGHAQLVKLLSPEKAMLITSDHEMVIPVTGVQNGSEVERYGQDVTSWIRVRPDQPIKIPLP